MFSGWTPDEIQEFQGRKQLMEKANELKSRGLDKKSVARHLGISSATIARIRTAWAMAKESGNYKLFLKGKSTGRPALELLEVERTCLGNAMVRVNRGKGVGSITSAARFCASDPKTPLRQEVRDAILKPRCSKHIIPVNVRRACRGMDSIIADYRNPLTRQLGGIYAPGTNRMTRDADGKARRLEGGERWCVDDASINFGVCIPWSRKGDPCSAKYGVRLGRYQLLPAIDCAGDFCTGYTYSMRANDAYRGDDVVAMLDNAMTLNGYRPKQLVIEGGVWQSKRVLEFLEQVGIEIIDAKGRPNQKLIEGWFSRMWTRLSYETTGQIGRSRGEMSRENELWMKCRAGALDPRRHFPMIETALNAIDRAVKYVNSDVAESKDYGKWIPQEVHSAGLLAYPRPAYNHDLGYLAARVREKRRIHRYGMVSVTAMSALGQNEKFTFADYQLAPFNGAEAWVHFDPFAHPIQATITLAGNFQEYKSGTVIAQGIEPLNSAPEIVRCSDGSLTLQNVDGIANAKRAKDLARMYVRRETRSLGLDGARVASISEISSADEHSRTISIVPTGLVSRTPRTPKISNQEGVEFLEDPVEIAALPLPKIISREAMLAS